SLLVGVMLAIVNFARVVLLEGYPIEIGLVVCVTLVFTVVVAKCLGGFLPIVAKKLGFDPALMASPLITTIVDSISLLIYFAIASVVLGI
ncbi:MAG: magnesium transporter, partial [Clostridiales bacterium]|nr:magnesium transporter [Clostridiales bacterium]